MRGREGHDLRPSSGNLSAVILRVAMAGLLRGAYAPLIIKGHSPWRYDIPWGLRIDISAKLNR
jgi:hypothetical protein